MKILSFDIEEWFHLLDHEGTEKPQDWQNFPKRLDSNVKRILDILDNNNLKATFFVLGWVAKHYPELVKEISRRGHEIGTHSFNHQLVYKQNKEDFEKDLKDSINILSDLIGLKITCYRAPGFSIKKEQLWAFEILKDNGIEIDCSVFPTLRSHGGFKEFHYSEPVKIKLSNSYIKAFPMNLAKTLAFKYVFSGGGYFRFLPYSFINHLAKKSDYMMTYFHPRDFDPTQPRLDNLSYLKYFKSYVGLKTSEAKLRRLLKNHKFYTLSKANSLIDWENASIFDIEQKKSL